MQHIFDFHNEHRIVTVRLFLEAMVALTGKVDFKGCMLLGSAQLLIVLGCFAWFLLKHFGEQLGWLLLAAASWHLFSMLNFDNAFWALTALENFGVLMWAFLAIILFHLRRFAVCFVAAWLCAVLAALTSAQGLAVSGVLCLMALVPDMYGDSAMPDGWRGLVRTAFTHLRKPQTAGRALACAFFAGAVVVLYFRGFCMGADATEAAGASALDRVLYILAFIGNLVPIYPVALVCGCFMAIAIGFIAFRFPKIPKRLHPVFFFMIYLVGVSVAGVAFRGADPRAALSFRYYVITACLFISVTMLLSDLMGNTSLTVRIGVPLLVVGFALLDLAVFFVGWPMFAERNNALRVNMLTWPEHAEGLRVSDDYREQASNELRRLESLERYDHKTLLRQGEQMPKTPIPWPKPYFP